MLERLEASHFESLQGHAHVFEIPNGAALELRVDSVTRKPKSSIPGSAREPFTVNLTSTMPTHFIEGLCATELPGVGRVENIMVSRQAALGRPPQLAYFQILFN